MTVIKVYGDDSGIQAAACGQNRNFVSKSLVEEKSPADVICYFFFVFDELHSLFKSS
jgi:hypothetical protein